jgi:hypothetical protein
MVDLKDQGKPKKVKPKAESQATKKKSKSKSGIDSSEIDLVLMGGFGLLSTVLGEHWQITGDEAEMVSDPLVRVLDKLPKKTVEKINSMAAPTSLVVALGAIIVPRTMIEIEKWRYKREALRFRNDPQQTINRDRGMETENAGAAPTVHAERSQGENDGYSIPSVPAELNLEFGE